MNYRKTKELAVVHVSSSFLFKYFNTFLYPIIETLFIASSIFPYIIYRH
nr:MAG TPA: hypothetical protein [Caudoviricetes sp.]